MISMTAVEKSNDCLEGCRFPAADSIINLQSVNSFRLEGADMIYIDQIVNQIFKKTCLQCHQEKDISEYYKKDKNRLSNFCKDCDKIKWRAKYRKNHPVLRTEINKEKRRERRNELQRKIRLDVKIEVLGHYSQGTLKCVCCGEEHIELLTIDHINGDGTKHRREIRNPGGSTFYRWLRSNNYPGGYRVLCHNCNLAYAYYGYCPHQKTEPVPNVGGA